MNDQVIEPSEIIIDGQGLPREDTTKVNPWIRFLARFFDYSLFFLFIWWGRSLLLGHLSTEHWAHLVPFEYFSWIPIEALFLTVWGQTPGKFFLKVSLKQGKKGRLDFFTALKRSFNVWFRGMGLGIPVVMTFCLLIAYQRLRLFQKTSWDRDENIAISHRPIGRWRVVTAAVVIVGALLFYYNTPFTKIL